MAEAYIIDACRTPRGIGKIGKGGLSHLHPQHLGATVLKAIAERNNLNTEDVDDIIWGTNAQKGKQIKRSRKSECFARGLFDKILRRDSRPILWVWYYNGQSRCGTNFVGDGRCCDCWGNRNDELYKLHQGPQCHADFRRRKY